MKRAPLLLLLAACGGGPLASGAEDFVAPAPSRLPELASGPGGRAWLTWVEAPEGAPARLLAAPRGSGAFGPAREVARGGNWFLNWADFPALAAASDSDLAATWLERSGAGTYDYRVRLVRSRDGGGSWSEPVTLHDHAGGGEHGFVSLVALGAATFAAAWLDGRDVREEGGRVEGAMSLRARTFGPTGDPGPEALLDARVCDCCQTAAVAAPGGGILVAYRDRSEDEVRDVSIVRWRAGSGPEILWRSADAWRIAGCPVNGPALAVDGQRVAVTWFTLGADGEPRVLAATSSNGGRSFAPAVRVAGPGSAGRVDALFDRGGGLVVSWLQEIEGESAWCVRRLGPSGASGPPVPVAPVEAGRSSGFARLARDGDGILIAFTEGATEPRVRVLRLTWP